MERQVLDEQAPLYNRRTGAMKLEPLDYAEAALFFPDYAPEEKMAVYAVLGGMPSYLEQFNPVVSLKDNVLGAILRPNTYLSEEPDWLLLEDLRKDVIYGSILRAVAAGARKPSDIARGIGKNSAQEIGPQLSTLQDLGLLLRETPITEKRQPRSRISLYYINDNYLDFWYRFVDPARSLVVQDMGLHVWNRLISPHLNEYISRPTFERACRQYLWRAMRKGALPEDLHLTDVGCWWGVGDIEIDVVGTDEKGRVTLAGSCKWTEAPMDVREYAALQKDLSLAGLRGVSDAADGDRTGDDPLCFLFSRSGFTERLSNLALKQRPQQLHLISLEDLYQV
jgi:hypothetical protein